MTNYEKIAREKLSKMTKEQKFNLYADYYDCDWCRICIYNNYFYNCHGITLGARGLIYPKCADDNPENYVDYKKLDDECFQIILDEGDKSND